VGLLYNNCTANPQGNRATRSSSLSLSTVCRRTPVAAALRYLASSVRGLTELELLDLLSCNDDAVTAAVSCDVTDDNRTTTSQSRLLCRFPCRLWYDIRNELGTYPPPSPVALYNSYPSRQQPSPEVMCVSLKGRRLQLSTPNSVQTLVWQLLAIIRK